VTGEQCDRCTQPKSRTFGALHLCEAHYAAEVEVCTGGQVGVGVTVGPAPGWPDGWRNARCTVCGATWTADRCEQCAWCVQRFTSHAAQANPVALVCTICRWRWNGTDRQPCPRPTGCAGHGDAATGAIALANLHRRRAS
jgi:hypothetical protein